MHDLLIFLWWGRFRFLFEPFARLLLKYSRKIYSRPLRGYEFSGGLAQMLGIYEFPLQNAIEKHFVSGEIFYDIGANNGFFTLFAANCTGGKGEVHAFEPFPKIRDVIQKNSLKNCHLVEYAVSDFAGETDLFYSLNASTPSIVTPQVGGYSNRIAVTLLDEYVKTHPFPSVIKLDIEGAETAVLRGASKLIKSTQPRFWIIELHNPEDQDLLLSLLSPGNYVIEQIPKPGKEKGGFPIHLIAHQ